MKKYLVFLLLISLANLYQELTGQNLRLVSGDFHQHTSFSDGGYAIDYIMSKNDEYGLDWWVISDHGGGSIKDGRNYQYDDQTKTRVEVFWDQVLTSDQFKGSPSYLWGHHKMWMWQCLKEYSFPRVIAARNLFADKIIFQGFEMNVPGHQHASVCILGKQYDANPLIDQLAAFEYRFDDLDLDGSGGQHEGWNKSSLFGHQKALEAIEFLQSNYRHNSWFILAHPDWIDPSKGFDIRTIREFNNIGPDVCFGFEGMPGSQKNAVRGLYSNTSVGGGTYGGAGYYTALVGGLWDALLSEGRHWWIFANSDNHINTGTFYPGEYQRNYTWVKEEQDPRAIIDGLRSGNSFIVTGDLIDNLEFSVNDLPMGSDVHINDKSVKIKILFHDPQGVNRNTYSGYNSPVLDHIDLIAGEISGFVKPEDPAFNEANAPKTRVLARYDAIGNVVDKNGLKSVAWNDLGNGWHEINVDMPILKDSYFRLRGTNMGLNVPNETNENGDPLCDLLKGSNSGKLAFDDLWFYSNPIFVRVGKSTDVEIDATLSMSISPNPSIDGNVKVKVNMVNATLEVCNMNGVRLVQQSINGFEQPLNLSGFAKGVYMIRVESQGNIVTQKVVVK